ncbi:MAG: RICIN domain-containing protein [Prevotella sp.]|nr:RICIN domain-containing protein [Prevotella sp.]MDD6394074.1 RICIN domain-containing protein [Prevotella sp.]
MLLLSFATLDNESHAQVSAGTYMILSSINNNHVIDLNGSQINDGNNIHIWTKNYTDAQKWMIFPNGDGTYTIASIINRDHVIDLNNSKINDGNNIHIWTRNNSNAQKWYFEKSGSYYIIRSAVNRDYVIDLNSSQIFDGNNIHIWKFNNTNAQKWVLTRISTSGGQSKTNTNKTNTNKSNNSSYTPQPIQVFDNCLGCNGSGRCNQCDGTGTHWYWSGLNHRSMPCSSCGHSGVCPVCNGSRGSYHTEYR